MSLFELQPYDHIRHICSFLNFTDVIKLSQVSKIFYKINIKKYIKHIIIIEKYQTFLCDKVFNKLLNIIKIASIYTFICINNNLGDDELKLLCDYFSVSLQVLNLKSNHINKIGSRILRNILPKLINLHTVDISNNHMSDKKVMLLEEVLNHLSIKTYDISGNTYESNNCNLQKSKQPRYSYYKNYGTRRIINYDCMFFFSRQDYYNYDPPDNPLSYKYTKKYKFKMKNKTNQKLNNSKKNPYHPKQTYNAKKKVYIVRK